MNAEDKELLKRKAAAIVEDVFDRAKAEATLRVTALIEENVTVDAKVNQDKIIADVVAALQKNGIVDAAYFDEPEPEAPEAPVAEEAEAPATEEGHAPEEPKYNPYAD